MKNVIEAILGLQPQYSSLNTDDMKLRGYFIRHDGPDWLRAEMPRVVELMRNSHPRTALIVVHGIVLEGPREAPTSTGGELRLIYPWSILETDLRVVGYQYNLVQTGGA